MSENIAAIRRLLTARSAVARLEMPSPVAERVSLFGEEPLTEPALTASVLHHTRKKEPFLFAVISAHYSGDAGFAVDVLCSRID